MTQAFEQTPEELSQWLEFIDDDIENVRRVIDFCGENDLEVEFKVHAKSETVEESAENVGVEEEKIVKTLVFKSGEEFVAVLCPGDSRVSEDKLEDLTSEDVRMANPDEVKEHTGYFVGGVSPFDLNIRTLMEEEILEHGKVKPASGSRVVGVEVDPEELKQAIDAEPVDVSEK